MNYGEPPVNDAALTIGFKRLSDAATLPTKAYEGDAGIDFYTPEDVVLGACGYRTIKTGIAAVIPDGYALVIRDRSSLGSRGIGHLGGVIDCGYRGEIGITLANLGPDPIAVAAGSKIAQALLVPVPKVAIVELDGLPTDTERGARGYGSSGA